MNPSTVRLNFKLNLIRHLRDGKRMTLEELSSVTGIKNQKDLKEQLGELFFLGATPHIADLIQVDYDSETDTFGLILPFRFDSSLRLSIREWLTLRKILEEVTETSSDPQTNLTARKILQKIISIVPVTWQEALSSYKADIQEAIRNEKSLSLEYQSRTGEKPTWRKVDPWFLFHSLEDYLLGYCHERNAPRNFRLDNILSLKIGSDPISKPAGQKKSEYIREFEEFRKNRENSSGISEIWHTKEVFYNLNRKLGLERTDETKKLNHVVYYLSKAKIREENWFLETLLPFGKNVILKSPTHLVKRILGEIESTLH
ncbi:helix-turn-helix transcriptional regulator [Leptospira mayottensis]|uniref:WYL domain protein n=2 Tax=Leptospira mayottensis TaxID=1137606 RepID=A0AA87MTI0_9LEPT|nr:WYL domain-containing protein [Leptospira mayottensis]AXR60422.1 WYL domain-containing protein [Leptospira mayottensis]AXR64236.1 WYL domain-containing protein [Leptospira mayottensis]AZQ03149.1 WYL domain-containing protein [Leptospira mayottensis 200901116]EKS02234.1 WYL domain protein [Leptospira mayottensis 200901122]TGN09212.1 WYL domain-containing protein [Leptospira mayottensis]